MKKSVYSLMVFDEIIDQIDELAEENNQNRSQIINQILADYLGMITPEQKVQSILMSLNNKFKDKLRIKQFNKNSSIHFDKSIDYKYKPKIKYSFEFIGSGDRKYAVFKISSRSKSVELNQKLENFFKKITEIEQKNHLYLGIKPDIESKHMFVREFRIEGSLNRDPDKVARFLSNYLIMFDKAINIYFSNKSSKEIEESLSELFNLFFESRQLQIIKENPIEVIKENPIEIIN